MCSFLCTVTPEFLQMKLGTSRKPAGQTWVRGWGGCWMSLIPSLPFVKTPGAWGRLLRTGPGCGQPDLTGPALSGQELGAENFGPDPLYRNCPVLLPLSVFGLLKLGIFIKFLQREWKEVWRGLSSQNMILHNNKRLYFGFRLSARL